MKNGSALFIIVNIFCLKRETGANAVPVFAHKRNKWQDYHCLYIMFLFGKVRCMAFSS